MNIFRTKTLLLATFAAVGLPQSIQAQTGYGFVNPWLVPGGTPLPQYTLPAKAASCSQAVLNAAQTLGGLGVACLGNGQITADIVSGCSPIQYGSPPSWIYPAECNQGCPPADIVRPTNGAGRDFCKTVGPESKVTPKDNTFPSDSVPTGTAAPAVGEYLPSDQQGPGYNFLDASNRARHGVLGVQIHIQFPGTMNRFVLRIPNNWNHQTLITAAANGLASEHTYDRTVSDWAVAQGYAYMGSNKGTYMQTTFGGLWNQAQQKYLPIRPNETQPDGAACQFAPNTYFNPLFDSEFIQGVRAPRGIQNNHKFIHIPSLMVEGNGKTVLVNWRKHFVDAVKAAKTLIAAQTGFNVTQTIAFGVSAGGGVVKSIAEYAEPPATSFVDGVLEVAGIQLSADSNNIINVYSNLIKNWEPYVGTPPTPNNPATETAHFSSATTAYTSILQAGFPGDLFNTNPTGFAPGFMGRPYNTSWPQSPRGNLSHPDQLGWPLNMNWNQGGTYLDWTMNSSIYWLQCMFVRGFDPGYVGTIDAYPVTQISTPGTAAYNNLQDAGPHTGAINTPIISLGGNWDSFAPPAAMMLPYHTSITNLAPAMMHMFYEYRNTGHLDALATAGLGQDPPLFNNSFGLHFMLNKAKEPLVRLISSLDPKNPPPPPSQCVLECTSLSPIVGNGGPICKDVPSPNPCVGDHLEYGIDPKIPQNEVVNW